MQLYLSHSNGDGFKQRRVFSEKLVPEGPWVVTRFVEQVLCRLVNKTMKLILSIVIILG